MGKLLQFQSRESKRYKALKRIDSLDWKTWRLNKIHKKILRVFISLNKELIPISEELLSYITLYEYQHYVPRLMNLGFIEYVMGDQFDEPNEWLRLITLYPPTPQREKTVNENSNKPKT